MKHTLQSEVDSNTHKGYRFKNEAQYFNIHGVLSQFVFSRLTNLSLLTVVPVYLLLQFIIVKAEL
jgi:hypothetical protein